MVTRAAPDLQVPAFAPSERWHRSRIQDGMSTTPRRPVLSTVNEPDSRDAMLDDTIESSFPASDPPSSIPDPGPQPGFAARDAAETLASSPVFWAALGAVAISAVWLGLSWQRAGRRW
jgi:hypothetical protein